MSFDNPKKVWNLSRSSVGSVILALSPSVRRAGGPDGGTTMSYVIATPGIVQAAAADVASICSSLSEASASAAAPTTTVTAAAGDEVSAGPNCWRCGGSTLTPR